MSQRGTFLPELEGVVLLFIGFPFSGACASWRQKENTVSIMVSVELSGVWSAVSRNAKKQPCLQFS